MFPGTSIPGPDTNPVSLRAVLSHCSTHLVTAIIKHLSYQTHELQKVGDEEREEEGKQDEGKRCNDTHEVMVKDSFPIIYKAQHTGVRYTPSYCIFDNVHVKHSGAM